MPDPDFDRLRDSTPEDANEADVEVLERERRDLENARLREAVASLEQDREQRKIFSYLLFGLVAVWLVAILSIVIVDGASEETFALPLAATLLLISSTTASIGGLFVFVARYLLPSRDRL